MQRKTKGTEDGDKIDLTSGAFDELRDGNNELFEVRYNREGVLDGKVDQRSKSVN